MTVTIIGRNLYHNWSLTFLKGFEQLEKTEIHAIVLAMDRPFY